MYINSVGPRTSKSWRQERRCCGASKIGGSSLRAQISWPNGAKASALRRSSRISITSDMHEPPFGSAVVWTGSAAQDRRCCGRHDLAAKDDVLFLGIFAPVMADASDARHEQHARGHALREDLGVMAGTAGHARVGTRGMALRGCFERVL